MNHINHGYYRVCVLFKVSIEAEEMFRHERRTYRSLNSENRKSENIIETLFLIQHKTQQPPGSDLSTINRIQTTKQQKQAYVIYNRIKINRMQLMYGERKKRQSVGRNSRHYYQQYQCVSDSHYVRQNSTRRYGNFVGHKC
jgi:hypothetical protein